MMINDDFQLIYSNEYFKIVANKNSIFRIEFAYSNPRIINSLIKTKILQGAISTDNYKTIKFKAHSIMSFAQFQEERNIIIGTHALSINASTQMVANLTTQLKYLISNESHTILGYSPENIIVINRKKFAYLGSDFVSEIKDNKTLISYPFMPSDFFISPELLKVNSLPAYIHYKTSYFSLACLIVYALSSKDNFYQEYLKEAKPIKEANNIIQEYLNTLPIKNTKLYWLLSRCLVEEPENRSILFI